MSYIAPNSTVEFFSDLGLSDNYENSLFFATTTAKDNYFSNLTKHTSSATALSYTRSERGTFRVEKTMASLLGCQYIRFKNTSFENKWFYAFVKDVRYINNITTELSFKLDVLMTWMGSFSLTQCFIEREHSITDAIGSNILPEDLDLGEYVINEIGSFDIITPRAVNVVDGEGNVIAEGGALNYDICVTSAVEEAEGSTNASPKFDPVKGGSYGRVFSGLSNEYFYGSNIGTLEKFLERITKANKSDAIVSIKMTPSQFRNEKNEPPKSYTKPVSKPAVGDSVGGHTPKNNKLYTYPYNFLEISDGEGKTVNLAYEFFGGDNCLFNFQGVTGAISEVACIPLSYKRRPINYEYQLTINDFPDCAYAIDSYEAWLALHKNESFYMNGVGALGTITSLTAPIVGGAIGGMTTGARIGDNIGESYNINLPQSLTGLPNAQLATNSGIIGSVAGGVIGTALGGASGYINVSKALAQNRDRMTKAPSIHGNQTTNLGYVFGRKDFYHTRKSITAQYALIIDNYFTMYGYKQNAVGVPLSWGNAQRTLNGRPAFAYTKTSGCTVHGNLPSDHASTIESIFDNGIRFWRNHNNIGNYSINNSV